MTNKRAREVQVQAWFDPEDESERFVLEMLQHLQKTYGDKPKQAMYRAFYALNMVLEQDDRVPMPPMPSRQSKMIVEIKSAIDALAQLIKNGNISAIGDENAKVMLQTAAWNMNELERGLAESYRPMDLSE